MLRDQGHLPAALDNHKTARAIRERLVRTDPDNTGWQNSLAGAHSNIGDLLRAQGDLAATLDSYKAAQAIMERLVATDPGNTGWQNDLAVARERVGNVLRDQGNLAAALDSYKAAQAIRERLVTIDPGNTGWQSNLSFSHTNIGGVLRAQGNLAAALDNHKTAQAIRERLVTTDPGNASWQNDLTASHSNIGGVLRAQGNLPAALDSYKAAQAIRERLVTTDPGNTAGRTTFPLARQHRRFAPGSGQPPGRATATGPHWRSGSAARRPRQRRLAAQLFRLPQQIGGVLRAQGNLAAALDNHKTAHAIRERLARPILAMPAGSATSPTPISISATCSGLRATSRRHSTAIKAARDQGTPRRDRSGKCRLAARPRRFP